MSFQHWINMKTINEILRGGRGCLWILPVLNSLVRLTATSYCLIFLRGLTFQGMCPRNTGYESIHEQEHVPVMTQAFGVFMWSRKAEAPCPPCRECPELLGQSVSEKEAVRTSAYVLGFVGSMVPSSLMGYLCVCHFPNFFLNVSSSLVAVYHGECRNYSGFM